MNYNTQSNNFYLKIRNHLAKVEQGDFEEEEEEDEEEDEDDDYDDKGEDDEAPPRCEMCDTERDLNPNWHTHQRGTRHKWRACRLCDPAKGFFYDCLDADADAFECPVCKPSDWGLDGRTRMVKVKKGPNFLRDIRVHVQHERHQTAWKAAQKAKAAAAKSAAQNNKKL